MPAAGRQLSAQQQQILARASDEGVAVAMSELRPSLQHRSWLPDNRYLTDILKHLEAEREGQGPHKHDGGELARYFAASIPLHCSDGWTFLSQSVASLLNGDWASALHLAYYAELRASMSFLASEGIGIFNRYHLCIDSQRCCHAIDNINTHKMAWLALEEWANHPRIMSRLLTLLRVEGTAISEWLAAAEVSAGIQSRLEAEWLKDWSLDLRLLMEDRERRNTVSYRPTRLHNISPIDSRQSCDAITHFWEACEPGGAGSFTVLDRHLLRIALEKGFKAIGTTPSRSRRRLRQAIEQARHAAPGKPKGQELAQFLARKIDSEDHLLLRVAAEEGSATGTDGALPVIARATLLLRLASAACANHLKQAGMTMQDLQFWWEPYGYDLGLWDTGGTPSQFSDLWKDIEEAVIDNRDWWGQNHGQSVATARLRRELGSNLAQLNSFQLAGLWSLGL